LQAKNRSESYLLIKKNIFYLRGHFIFIFFFRFTLLLFLNPKYPIFAYNKTIKKNHRQSKDEKQTQKPKSDFELRNPRAGDPQMRFN